MRPKRLIKAIIAGFIAALEVLITGNVNTPFTWRYIDE
jgi:hypothetical protein